jgi:hypothetical protein
MNLKDTVLSAVITAVVALPSTYYFARQRALQEAQQRHEQEKRQASDAEKQTLEDFTRVLASMRFALVHEDLTKFREEALAYFERRSRHEFDLATEPRDFSHPNPLTGEAVMLDLQLVVYTDLLKQKPTNKKESDRLTTTLEAEERMLDVTVTQLAKDGRSRVIETNFNSSE